VKPLMRCVDQTRCAFGQMHNLPNAPYRNTRSDLLSQRNDGKTVLGHMKISRRSAITMLQLALTLTAEP